MEDRKHLEELSLYSKPWRKLTHRSAGSGAWQVLINYSLNEWMNKYESMRLCIESLWSAQRHSHLVHWAEKPGTAFPRIPCSSWLWVSSAKKRLSRGPGGLRRKRNHDVQGVAVCRYVGIQQRQMFQGITLRITLFWCHKLLDDQPQPPAPWVPLLSEEGWDRVASSPVSPVKCHPGP